MIPVLVLGLRRRTDRRARLAETLARAGFDAHAVEIVDAIDGRDLSRDELGARGVTLFPNWKIEGSPIALFARDLKWGEVGCALSHLEAWRRIAEGDAPAALVLEDDVFFEGDVAAQIEREIAALTEKIPDWDLCYVGRGPVREPPFVSAPPPEEVRVLPSIVRPSFSYLAHAYVLSKTGARKLLDQRLPSALFAVDEFLPALYARHPRDDVRARYGEGDRIRAFAIEPSLAFAGKAQSDTEDSAFVASSASAAARETTAFSDGFGISALFAETTTEFLTHAWPSTWRVHHGSIERLALPRALYDVRSVLDTPDLGLTVFERDGTQSRVLPGEGTRAFDAGKTLYVIGIDRAFPALRAACHALARDLGIESSWISVEGFASRAGSGTRMHFDFDLNFNVQLVGKKTWRIAKNADVENPLASVHVRPDVASASPFDGRIFPSKMPDDASTYDVAPGSVVFLPRGVWHETHAHSDSFALSFVVKPPTYAVLLANELTRRLLTDPRWRDYPLTSDRVATMDDLVHALHHVLPTLRASDVFFDLERHTWSPRVPTHTLARLDEPKDGERWRLTLQGPEIHYELPIGDEIAPIVGWLAARNEPFSTDDLLAGCPGAAQSSARKVVLFLSNLRVLERRSS